MVGADFLSLQDSSETWRRLRLQQIFFKSVVQNDIDMVVRCLHHGADIGEEYSPVIFTLIALTDLVNARKSLSHFTMKIYCFLLHF